MKKIRALSGFSGFTDAEFLGLSHSIIKSMTDNEYFTDPIPPIDVIQETCADFEKKLARAPIGSRYDREVKKEARAHLSLLLQQLASYVNFKALGDLTMLLSSGFTIYQGKQTLFPPETPEYIKLIDGRISGEIQIRFKAVPNAQYYEYCCTATIGEDKQPVWENPPVKMRSSFRNYISGLTPGVKYYVKIRAHNQVGHSDWSEPVSLIVR